jgi:tartrate-resistant acid phosphatase type 5
MGMNTSGSCVDLMMVGDFGFKNTGQKNTAASMDIVAQKFKPMAILGLGDLVYPDGAKGSFKNIEERWSNIYLRYSSLKLPWFMCLGNHDWGSDARKMIEFAGSSSNTGGHWKLPSAWYKTSFTSAATSVELFMIDSMVWMKKVSKYLGSSAKADQEKWLREQLGKSKADWKVVALHHPIYVWGSKNSIGGPSFNPLVPILHEHRASVALMAHFHHQNVIQRGGITYALSGSGGQDGSKTKPPKGDLKQYSGGGGFMTASFCSKSEATLDVYQMKGIKLKSIKMTNDPQAGPPASPPRRRGGGGGGPPRRRDSRRRKSSSSRRRSRRSRKRMIDPTEERVCGEFEGACECGGVTLTDVKSNCFGDPCVVQVDRESNRTCESYCADHDLACVSGWTETDAEDCTENKEIGCHQATEDDNNNKICQCEA